MITHFLLVTQKPAFVLRLCVVLVIDVRSMDYNMSHEIRTIARADRLNLLLTFVTVHIGPFRQCACALFIWPLIVRVRWKERDAASTHENSIYMYSMSDYVAMHKTTHAI